jgi:branched-chain amino acid transport system ATP-binding protein
MILEITDLNVRYGGAKVLNGLSLNAEEGEIVTIIGNNGAGKTTTLRTISGLKRPGDRACASRERPFPLHGRFGKHHAGRVLAKR